MSEPVKTKTRIDIPYLPFKFDTHGHTVTKSADGSKAQHRYLKGITSGTKIDGQGERMTAHCIESLQKQGQAGTVLLYADRHGVAYTDDIGILSDSSITPEGDWLCEFRLYDETDGVSQNCLDTIDKLWKQVNGLHPYKTPLQKGFSIEGYVPEGGILSADQNGGKRVLDDIILDGAVVVPRPAYQSSVASAVFKALGENSPWVMDKVAKEASSFKTAIATDELKNNYFKYNYKYNDKLEELIQGVMGNPGIRDKKEALNKVFTEFSDSMIELIIQSQESFGINGKNQPEADFHYQYTPSANTRMEVMKGLSAKVDELINIITKEV